MVIGSMSDKKAEILGRAMNRYGRLLLWRGFWKGLVVGVVVASLAVWALGGFEECLCPLPVVEDVCAEYIK